MKKAYPWLAFGLVIAFLLIFTGVNLHKFHNDSIDDLLITEEADYENPISKEKVTPTVIEKEHCFVSDSFVMTDPSQMQIRFRVMYSLPFMHTDIFHDTAFYIEDDKGNDLTSAANVCSEKFMGLNGLNITLIFKEGDHTPASGDRLSVTIASAEGVTTLDADKSYAYGKFEIVIP